MKTFFLIIIMAVCVNIFNTWANNINKKNMVSIIDINEEIKRIRKYGSVEENKMLDKQLRDTNSVYYKYNIILESIRSRDPNRTYQPPSFMSDRWGDYGNSKYDKGLNWMYDIVEKPDSLKQLGYNNQTENEYENGVVIVVILMIVIVIVYFIFLNKSNVENEKD